jgi:beta-carotene 3-hydroxylase
MEWVGWCLHKYLFHGPLWFIHQSHHRPHGRGLEWNDLFSLLFALAGIGMGWMGLEGTEGRFGPLLLGAGIGVSLYGLVYFVVHDAWVHRRWHLPRKWSGTYLNAMIKAHRAHHVSMRARPSESYGLLIFPRKFLKDRPHKSAMGTVPKDQGTGEQGISLNEKTPYPHDLSSHSA